MSQPTPAAPLPAPEGTVYIVVGAVFRSPGRPDIPVDSPPPE